MIRVIFLAVAVFMPLVAIADAFSLSAEPGQFRRRSLGLPAGKISVSVSMRMLKFNSSQGWPSAAHVGFHQGADLKQSVRFFVIGIKETDPYLVAAYRVFEDGKETKEERIANLPVQSVVRVTLSFDGGIVTLRMNNHPPITVSTGFTQVAPYVSVQSGTAEFEVDR